MKNELSDPSLIEILEKYSIQESLLKKYLDEEKTQMHVMELIERLVENYSLNMKNILVVGAGRGGLTSNLMLQGYEVESIEPCKPYVDIIKYKYKKYGVKGKIYNDMLENLSLNNNFYDFVALIDVIEHVEDPILSLKIYMQF